MSIKFNPFSGEFIPGGSSTPTSPNSLQSQPISGSPEHAKSLVYNSQTSSFEYKSRYIGTNVLDFIPSSEHARIMARASTLDLAPFINAAITSLATAGGTLIFPDGTFTIASPIILRKKVHMVGMAKTATIKALPTFNYTNATFPKKALIKTDLGDTSGYYENGLIDQFTLDGANVADFGLEIIRGRFTSIKNMDIIACREGGIFSGSSNVSTTYEIKFEDIWIWRTDVLASSTSIGFTLRNSTDCYPSQVIVIGYAIGFKSFEGSGGNHFIQCHAWNRPINGPLKYVFWCGGPNDAYVLCYADTPVDGTNEAYGFYVDALSQKITNSFVFNSAQTGYGADLTAFGIFCSANSSAGANCQFIANSFAGGGTTARLKQDIGGQYFLAEVFGNSSNSNVGFAITPRLKKGLLFSSGGNTSVEMSVRDTGASFLDNLMSFSPYPSGNGGTSTTTPGSINQALVAFFNQTSTVGQVTLDVFDGAAVINGDGQRFTTNIAHRFSANSVTPSYLGMTNNIGFGTRTPGAKAQITGGLIVTNVGTAVGDPGVGNIRTLGMAYGYTNITASRTQFTTDYYVNVDATAGPITYTLLAATTQVPGKTIVIKKSDSSSNVVTITAPSGSTIEGNASVTLTAQYASIQLYTNGSNIWLIAARTATASPERLVLTFINGWDNQIATAYATKVNGMVMLTGTIAKYTTPFSGDVITTLPIGWRPIQDTRFTTSDGASSKPALSLAVNGQLTYTPLQQPSSAVSHLLLSPVIYYAGN